MIFEDFAGFFSMSLISIKSIVNYTIHFYIEVEKTVGFRTFEISDFEGLNTMCSAATKI